MKRESRGSPDRVEGGPPKGHTPESSTMAIIFALPSLERSALAPVEFFAIEASHCDTDIFQAFLDEAARSIILTRKRTVLILDNASWHKEKKLNWHFFEPLYLPPYSPDYNPTERISLIVKAE
jgi:hypothetical protein